jgi:transcriptional regulator with XRE-family HTH domain
MKCPHCDKLISVEITLHDAREFKRHRISRGLSLSTKKLGAKRRIDRNEVMRMRNQAFSLQQIADLMGISKKSVCNIIREEKGKSDE